MARKRASMREGPLAELFRATEAAQRQAGDAPSEAPLPPQDEDDEQQTLVVPAAQETGSAAARAGAEEAALEETVEHVYEFPPADADEAAAETAVIDARARSRRLPRAGRRGRTGSRQEPKPRAGPSLRMSLPRAGSCSHAGERAAAQRRGRGGVVPGRDQSRGCRRRRHQRRQPDDGRRHRAGRLRRRQHRHAAAQSLRRRRSRSTSARS